MNKMIVCGKKNLNGKLTPAPLDGKNVSTDWIEDFLFDRNCVPAKADTRYCGFFSLMDCDDDLGEMLVDVFYGGNTVMYLFPACNYLGQEEADYFCHAAEEYFADDEFTLQINAKANKQGDYEPEITMSFFFREEE